MENQQFDDDYKYTICAPKQSILINPPKQNISITFAAATKQSIPKPEYWSTLSPGFLPFCQTNITNYAFTLRSYRKNKNDSFSEKQIRVCIHGFLTMQSDEQIEGSFVVRKLDYLVYASKLRGTCLKAEIFSASTMMMLSSILPKWSSQTIKHRNNQSKSFGLLNSIIKDYRRGISRSILCIAEGYLT